MPAVTARELLKFLKKQGYLEDRQKGNHLTLWNEELKKSITIPVHTGNEIGRGLAIRILKDAGYSIDDYISSK
jgi:predicted RNA binding protein YcfA (HicA-like mRNA interferase family)